MGRLRAAILAILTALVAGCAPQGVTQLRHVTHRAAGSPTAAWGGACAPVRTTMPIDQVPLACAELWAPYQVTLVPPPDVLRQEHVPPAPRVTNLTGGRVPDSVAQRWANASNRDSGWYKWAYDYNQPPLLLRLVGPALISRIDELALSDDARIDVPDCDLYPMSYTLFPIGPDGYAYFARKGLPTAGQYVFVVLYNGPCTVTTTYPDGQVVTRADFTAPTLVFAPGRLVTDRVLGDLWFTDTGGNCGDPAGPPAEWCSR